MTDKVIAIDAASLGPRNRRPGSIMTAWWPDRVETFTFDGMRWVLTKTEPYRR